MDNKTPYIQKAVLIDDRRIGNELKIKDLQKYTFTIYVITPKINIVVSMIIPLEGLPEWL